MQEKLFLFCIVLTYLYLCGVLYGVKLKTNSMMKTNAFRLITLLMLLVVGPHLQLTTRQGHQRQKQEEAEFSHQKVFFC